MNIPDNYDRWKQYDAEQQEQLDKLPKCEHCEEPIQSNYYFEIEGAIICEDCLNDNFRKDVEDY
jgi:formylmethanofuran dehydrogenase subunit E